MRILARNASGFLAGMRVVVAASTVAGAAAAAEPTSLPVDGLDVPKAVLAEQQHRVDVSAKASRAAVAIFAGEQGGGSGVLISPDGYALTNFHVVQPAGVAMKCGLSDGRLYDAVLVGLDPTGDVAVVKLLGRDDFPFAEMADSDEVRVGDECFTAGNPFLLATNFQPSIAWGIVSGVHRYQFPAGTILEYADCLQVDAAINPGNSGGALFDREGRLIGVNGRASFEKRGRVNVGVGYAISSNQVRNFLGGLKGGRIVDHATLGATVSTSFDGKVVVSDILESSDAYRRGLRYDDEIVSLADRPIRTVNAFKNALGTLPAGWRVPLVVRREGRRMEFDVRLAGVHARAELAKIAGEPAEEEPSHESSRGKKPKDLPEAVRPLYEPKLGFANHHFNRVERDRVARSLEPRGDARPGRGEWTLRGRLANGKPFTIRLSDDKASIDLPTGTTSIDAAGDLDAAPNPPGSGGLLAAMVLWRRMLLDGPAAVGRTEYLGTHPSSEAPPTAARGRLVDVLVTSVAGVEATFAVDDGSIRRIELWTEPDADPCEVRFSGTSGKEAAGTPRMPSRFDVWHGDGPFGRFEIESIDDGSEPAQDAPAREPPPKSARIGRESDLRVAVHDAIAHLLFLQVSTEAGKEGAVGEVIAEASKRVVKIYGAGGFRGLEAYQSGFLVTPRGHVMTVMSTVLDSDRIDCVLDDGRRYEAKLVGIDPRRELALLAVEGEDLPAFELPADGGTDRPAAIGSRVFAVSNLFGVAAGDERASIQRGVVSAFVPLEARRGGYEAVFDGDVYLLDFTVNNPGSPGGALVDIRGRLVGLLGKELRSTSNGTWLNYAIPAVEVATAYREILAGGSSGLAPPSRDEASPFDPVVLGIVLVPDLFDKTPPFVETVIVGSVADRAGLRADDLVIAVAGRSVTSRAGLESALAAVADGDSVRITFVRSGRVGEAELGPRPAAAGRDAEHEP